MSSETAQISVESNSCPGMNLKETELTLGLPRNQSTRGQLMKSGMKRGYLDMVDLKLGGSSSTTSEVTDNCLHHENFIEVNESGTDNSDASKPHRTKEQMVGWLPVRGCRKSAYMTMKIKKSSRYVKVAVDGAPYLRKVDLEVYSCYEQLLGALEELFPTCFAVIRNDMLNDRKLIDPVNGVEYVPTYKDKDGDWMLVGDVPWKMFVETCNRLRLMKSSEATGLAPPLRNAQLEEDLD